LSLPALFLFSQMAATVAFFVCARYRMTSVPFRCLFAAYAIVNLVAMFRQRERAAWAYLALAVLAGVGVNVDAYAISQERYSRPYYERAMIFRREGKTDAALELFSRASRERPDDPDVFFQWGVTLAGRGNYEGAAKLFEDAAHAEPRYSKSWFNLGLSLSRIKETVSAAVAYRKALEVDPSYWEAAVGLGDALIEEGAWDESAEAYRRSAELARTRREAAVSAMSLGRAEAMRGRYAESLEHFDSVLSAFPGSVDARVAKARVLMVLGRVEDAAAEARIAARADTSDARVKALLKDLGTEAGDQPPAEPPGDIR
jgi:tetratricopeptide (TPR) repeat protein